MEGFKNRIKNLFEEQEQLRQHYKNLNIIINNYTNTNKFSKTSNVLDDVNKQFSVMVYTFIIILYIGI